MYGNYSVEVIFLPNRTVYVGYGPGGTGNLVFFCGLQFGKGTWSNGVYTGTITSFTTCEQPYEVGTGSVSITGNGGAVSGAFSGGTDYHATVLPSSEFNFNTPAVLSSISGTWSVIHLVDRNTSGISSISIDASGNLNGTYDNGCSISGKVTPDTSNKNFFDLSITYGGPPCLPANQSGSGIAVLLPTAGPAQLEFWASSGTTFGMVLVSQ